MWSYPEIDPVALSLGPLKIHWYALSYLVGISLAWWVAGQRRTRLKLKWSDEQMSDIVFYAVIGTIAGGRIGYMLFYGYNELLENPLVVFKVWQGGMSFHGGLIGVSTAMWVYARKSGRSLFQIMDFVAPVMPLALGCGRIGNFINAELPGRAADVPWAVIYPGDVIARHPSSLYQAATEGLVLFCLLYWYGNSKRPRMAISGMFLLGYGCLRFATEFFREPDVHLGYVAFDWMTQGQLLCVPMVLLGSGLLLYSYRDRFSANR